MKEQPTCDDHELNSLFAKLDEAVVLLEMKQLNDTGWTKSSF